MAPAEFNRCAVNHMIEYLENKKLKELKEDRKNWEEWLGCIISNRHMCEDKENRDNLRINDSAIIYGSCENIPSRWILARVWLADEKEVSDGEAEKVGELLSSSCFRINFCPFCGVALSPSNKDIVQQSSRPDC